MANDAATGSDQSAPPDNWERTRIENPLYFASLTPGERVVWLAQMFE